MKATWTNPITALVVAICLGMAPARAAVSANSFVSCSNVATVAEIGRELGYTAEIRATTDLNDVVFFTTPSGRIFLYSTLGGHRSGGVCSAGFLSSAFGPDNGTHAQLYNRFNGSDSNAYLATATTSPDGRIWVARSFSTRFGAIAGNIALDLSGFVGSLDLFAEALRTGRIADRAETPATRSGFAADLGDARAAEALEALTKYLSNNPDLVNKID